MSASNLGGVIFGRKQAQTDDSDAGNVTVVDEEQPLRRGYTPPKGRATPKRSEAQATSKARRSAPTNRKEAAKEMRAKRAAESQNVRRAMATGDDRYLPARDKGPVKRAVRDFTDSRLMFAELVMPIMLAMLLLLMMRLPAAEQLVTSAWLILIVLVVIDLALFVMRLKKMLRTKFPGQSTKGVVSYGVLRATQLRPMRLPKPQVRIGGAPKPPRRSK